MLKGLFLLFAIALARPGVVWGEEVRSATLFRRLAVFVSPGGALKFYAEAGQRIEISPSRTQGYRRVRVMERGSAGAVLASDLEEALNPALNRKWALGMGLKNVAYSQKARTFQTSDSVQYTTSEYTSQQSYPLFVVQFRERNFWRLSLGFGKIDYSGSAKTSVSGSAQQDVRLQYSVIEGRLTRVWSWSYFYAGPAVGLVKTSSAKLELGGQTLKTSDSDNPAYVIGSGLVGAQIHLTGKILLWSEAQYGVSLNQSPSLTERQFVAGLAYWL